VRRDRLLDLAHLARPVQNQSGRGPTVCSPRRPEHRARADQSQASTNRTTSRRSPLKFTRIREPCAARTCPALQNHRVPSRRARQFARASSPTCSEPSPKPAGREAERARPARACAEVAQAPGDASVGRDRFRRSTAAEVVVEVGEAAARSSRARAQAERRCRPPGRAAARVRATARRRRQRGALQVRLHVPPALARRRGVASDHHHRRRRRRHHHHRHRHHLHRHHFQHRQHFQHHTCRSPLTSSSSNLYALRHV
jgi:hypothetical protein